MRHLRAVVTKKMLSTIYWRRVLGWWMRAGVIYFTNHHFITDWFVHTGVITYKWICRYFFFSIIIMLGQFMKLTNWHNFVSCDIWLFACGEILAKLCEISQTFGKISHFAKQEILHTTNLCYFVNFMFFIKHNFDWRENYLQIHLYVMTPVCTNQSVVKLWLVEYITPWELTALYFSGKVEVRTSSSSNLTSEDEETKQFRNQITKYFLMKK